MGALLFAKEVIAIDDSITVLKVISFLFFLPFDLSKEADKRRSDEDIFVEMCSCSLRAILRIKQHEESKFAVRNILRKVSTHSSSLVKIENRHKLIQLVSSSWCFCNDSDVGRIT